MKRIGLTMRCDLNKNYNETRDCIDQRWYSFLRECELTPFLIPNDKNFVDNMDLTELSGIIFTGGNSLHILGGDAPNRDSIELSLLESLLKLKMPILGVCRGMQLIQAFHGIQLHEIPDHVKTRHNLEFKGKKLNVNSYHEYGTNQTVSCLRVLSKAEDGIVEAIEHTSLPLRGIMWHPERENSFSNHDIQQCKELFA